MNKEIPIFFAVDHNYLPFLAVTIKSIIDNHKSNEVLKIKVLYTSIDVDDIKKISKYENDKVDIEFVNVTNYVKEFQDKLFTRDYYSETTYYRLFIPNLYPEYDKAIYLDSDCILLTDISELYNIDITNYLLAASPDEVIANYEVFQEYVEKVIGIKTYQNYFNAGVLLMNLKELRDFNLQDKFIYLLGTTKYAVVQDQDYLNRICKGRVKIIDASWDKMPIGEEIPAYLIHFNMHYKPWHYSNILYDKYFWNYAKETEY